MGRKRREPQKAYRVHLCASCWLFLPHQTSALLGFTVFLAGSSSGIPHNEAVKTCSLDEGTPRVMALEGPPSNVYGGFTRSVCVQCRPQWGRVQWWGGLTTQGLRMGRESSYVQQGKERERESCVERATCQALWPQRGSECPDHTPAPLPPALLPGSPTGHSQQVTEDMGAW